ncbi:MAG: hypothetical protein J0G37_12795 [Afipia sp.]|nr:hypothetical protein [Afipia sp.]
MNPAGALRGQPHQGNRKNRAMDRYLCKHMLILYIFLFLEIRKIDLLKIQRVLLNTMEAK